MSEAGEINWRKDAVKTYMQSVKRVKEQMLVLIHITGGQPARGTEILSVLHRNSMDNCGTRGIFVENGLVSIVTGYHETFGPSGKGKVVHRYLPKEVSELLVYYLWLVQPFVNILQMPEKVGGNKDIAGILHEDYESDESISDEEIEGKNNEVAHQNDRDFDAEEKSTSNPDGFWNTDRIKRCLHKESLARLGVKVGVSAWRHICIAIMREYSQDKRVHSVLDENEESHYIGQKSLSEANDFHDLQAGHSSRTAGMIYGRDLMESPFHTLNQREGFRRVSIEWHQILQFKSAWKRDEFVTGPRVQMEADMVAKEFQRWKTLRQINLEKQLINLLGPTAKFKGIQRPVLDAIKQRQSPIVTIIGTGGGKSLLFMLPASCSRDGVTIVIVPLIALRSNLKDRCDKAGISCVEWDSKRPADWSNIVLVTPEAAVGDKFSCFIDRRRAMGQLDLIVIDECHLVLDSKSGWRTQIMDLANMTKNHTQLLYLTATLPPSD
ncbi:hypothetical protein K3495_g10655 [Podosphaera aphanis]|nr:hypothetical protein K3495_g10655 [Podosphaera aphanis]